MKFSGIKFDFRSLRKLMNDGPKNWINSSEIKDLMPQDKRYRIAISISALGILLFLIVITLSPFKTNIFATLFPKLASHAASPTDWNQVGKNPQHTSFSTETLGTNYNRTWSHPFQPERVFPQVQAIVYSGKIFVPTESGNVYAFDTTSGNQSWKSSVGGSVISSAAADNGLVYISCLDGAVYALDANSGSQIWKTYLYKGSQQSSLPRLGFSTSPLLADNKVMLGGEDGYFYALDPTSGALLWNYSAGAPILQTAAFDNGKVFFGSMDMYVHAVSTTNGSQTWKSPKLKGGAFKDYYPVVSQGKVIERPMAKSFQWKNGPMQEIPYGGIPPDDLSDAAQTAALAAYDANPQNYYKTLYVYDENTGQEQPGLIHWNWGVTMHGATTPPCIDKDGYLIIPFETTWTRLSLNTRKVFASFTVPFGNRDENMNVTCDANGVFAMHTVEGNAQTTGFYNLTSNTWSQIIWGMTSFQLSTANEAAGGNPASISNGWLYHIAYNELIARKTN